MKTALADMLGSKKFLAAIATIAALILAKVLGWEVSEETLVQVLGAIGAIYIAAQGAADHGKEAAKHAADAKKAEVEAVKELNTADPGNA